MNYLRNRCSSLEDTVLMKLAVELCLNYQNLKTSILCFPERTYLELFSTSNSDDILGSKKSWEDIIEIEAKVVCEVTPLPRLKPKLLSCIRQIALRWISWSRQHEKMFELPRKFCSNFIIPDDWNVQGKLNGKKVAERLVQDQNIDVYQRYRIACTYFLESFIHNLWTQIPDTRKQYFCGTEDPNEVKENDLVKLWSYHMIQKVEKFIFNEKRFWQYGLLKAVETGMIESVANCWIKFSDVDRIIITQAAFKVLDLWLIENCDWKINFYNDGKTWFLPPMYYNDILCFLLANMLDEELIAFFDEAFQDPYYSSVLDCFLQWPFQDFFLPIINKLWDILPEEIYAEQLLSLVNMHAHENTYGDYQTLNEDYDYQVMLESLWEQTPNHYKLYLFSDMSESIGKELLLELLLKKPPNIGVVRCILKHATGVQKEKIFDEISDDIITKNGLKCFIYAVTECFSTIEKQNFLKRFILSESGGYACFSEVCDGNQAYANLLIDWGMFSDRETAEFKCALIFKEDNISAIGDLLVLDEVDSVERAILWCLPKIELQREFKKVLADAEGPRICLSFLENIKWEKLEQFLTWCFPSEEDIEHFKQRLFSNYGMDIHCNFISEGHWQEAELFLKWLRLTPEVIKNFKKDSLFSDSGILEIHLILCDLACDVWYLESGGKWEYIALILRWGLSDKNSVNSFKAKILKKYNQLEVDERIKENLKVFNEIIQERLCDLNGE